MAKKQVQDNSVKSQLDTSGLESVFATETANLKKRDALYVAANKKLEAQKKVLDSINQSMKLSTNLTKEQVSKIQNTVDAWAKAESVQSKALKDYKKGDISAKKYKQTIQEITKEFDNARKGVKLTGKENKELRKTISSMRDEMKSFGKAVDDTAKSIGFMDSALDQIGSSGIPMLREFSQVLKGISQKDLKAVTMALTAAGAAAAVLAKSYFFPDMKATQDVENEVKQMRTDNIADLAKIENKRATTIIEGVKNKSTLEKKIGLEISQNSIDTTNTVNRLNIDAQYASQKAAIQFNTTMMNSAAEFRAASKTAFFGKGLGSVTYGAAQLQLAGVGAEQIASSLSAATNVMGKRVSSELAADMAVMSKRTGQSAENLASVTEYFMRTDKVGAKSAINMQEGLRAMADSANVDLGGVMEEVAQASKEALGYQIKSGPALAKQVIYAKSLGVSFNDIAKAGKSMVLNYKDSIKNEMQLSAMLGRNVNLSEARSLFAQGKNDEALKSIQAQGLDPAKMNMFQQEALQQALGGLDLNSIQKVAQNTGRNGGNLNQVNANAANKGFLKTNTSAQASLASEQAIISAKQAIVDAKLSGEITKAYLASPGYLKYQNSLIEQEKQAMKVAQEEELRFKKSKDYLAQLIATAKNNIENMFSKDNFATLGVGLAGALAGNVIGKGIEKLVGGIQKVFVVNQNGGSDVTDMLDGPDSKSKNKKGRNPKGPRGPNGGSKMSRIFNSAKNLLPKVGNYLKPSNLIKGGSKLLKGGLAGIIGGMALDAFAENQAAKGNKKTAAGADIASSALSGAGYGAMLGSIIGPGGTIIGGAVGGLLGGAYGLYQNAGAFSNSSANKKVAAKQVTPAKSTAVPGGTTVKGSSIILSDVQYQTRLQMKMVELLGVNSILLQSILEETDKDKSIKLNGVKLNTQLMFNARKQMAVARKEAVGTNASM